LSGISAVLRDLEEICEILKKALAGERGFASFRAPPPNGAANRGDASDAGSGKVKESSNFPLTAELKALRFSPR